jgi:Na+-driven multidrug efflux pump
LNWILIYGKLGLPQMGIEGAAIANGISRALMTIAILIFIWRDEKVRELRKEFIQHTAISIKLCKAYFNYWYTGRPAVFLGGSRL